MSIDNVKDMNDFVMSQHSKMQPHTGEVKYERNPVSREVYAWEPRD